ncbi:yjeF C-terminal region, hydroxyethylthiazole kinase-related/yjeF N-terminal region [Kaistia soli DSM 19436]|uniref:Bifunctional NAD(P)H-hydrate repair enzyme n=1 Tax=Kaistia soli DSM 19436 TaxID=1122133 RepID=A0A1M4UMX4_9HYPH|nr:bifunctional ADP-dependent NAD(P)H-hydrate dehydratase/NAD(P)H-hydrate epimerase [Kaistia soli]SHE57923.1 yjeF C-terminal region, hydroxyethylthiazole kinase-related/yjeF N-terminal region [Kaistia soli DSM 19436]
MSELLTPTEMAAADAATIAAGTPGFKLMMAAARAVADVAARRPLGTRIAVACGPGNNGGDGFVAAQILVERGYRVSLGLIGSVAALKGDAALAAARWKGEVASLAALEFEKADLIIDALFGAGLDRPLAGDAAEAVRRMNAAAAPIIAVDLPSGINGATGAVMGEAVEADETVTFFRPKPGHMLLPGRLRCGRLSVADIGISADVLAAIAPRAFQNRKGLWLPHFPVPRIDGHKYDKGHLVVVSGPAWHTGAARMAARSGLRIGAGLATLASPLDALPENAAHLTAIMLRPMEGAAGLASILADERLNVVVLGPGLGGGDETRALVEAALASAAAVVLDADGISAFRDAPERLFAAIARRAAPVTLTPHDGEFARLFPDLAQELGKLDRARAAAGRSGAVVLLKGPDTVVAAPDGRASIADNAPPFLATAGSGDVLAGMIGGLLAQRMPAFEAASAATYLHGDAAVVLGRGLIAEDLPEALPRVFQRLFD